MSNQLTTWRQAIQALLTTTFPAAEVAAEVFPGEFTGPSRDKDRIRVIAAPLTPDSRNVNNTNPKLIVRYFVKSPKISNLTAEVLLDPGPLEQKMIDLANMFRANLTSVGGMDYYRVGPITPDKDEYGLEVELVGWTRNPAESGG